MTMKNLPVHLLKLPRVRFRLLLLVLAAMLFASFGGSDTSEHEGKRATHTIAIGSIEDVVTSQGKLEPKEYVDVGAQVSGQLKRIPVEIGDIVTPGQLLAEIDPRIYESRVAADKA